MLKNYHNMRYLMLLLNHQCKNFLFFQLDFNFNFYNYTFTSLWWRHSQPSNGRKSKIDSPFNRQRTGRCFQFSTSLSLHIYKVGSLCFMGVGREASITLNIFVLLLSRKAIQYWFPQVFDVIGKFGAKKISFGGKT